MFERLSKLFRRRSSAAARYAGVGRGFEASAREFATLVSGVRDYAVFLLDRQGRILTWNAGAERIKGYRAEEIIGRHFSSFYTNEALSSGWPAHELEVAVATGRFEDEGWRIRRDGSRFWASVVITTIRDDSGALQGFLKITRDITDRKQAEEKLRLSEERFRLLVEGVKDYAIFMLDPQGRVATWNTGAERLNGYRAAEIVGQHLSRFFPPEAVARGWPEEELRQALADGRSEDEGWRVRQDGSHYWASAVVTALRDDTGTLLGFAKITRDLTDRCRAEESARRLLQEEAARKAAQDAAEAIERQRQQLHVTLTSIGDAVVVTDERGAVTFLNPVAAALTGWDPQEAAGEPLEHVLRLINEETHEPVENPVQIVFRENRVVELANHTALVAKDGREIPIEDTAAPIRYQDETISGAVLVFRDVTEARRAMEARRYLAAIVQSSDDAIIGQTLDGRIASWNRGAERLYGYEAAEVVGKPLSILVPPDQPDELPSIMARLNQGLSVDHFETQRVRKDGSRVEVSLTISPVEDAEGKVIGASKIARDITARKEEDRRKTEFLALLAHELRNPLAPLRNGLQVIRLAGGDQHVIDEARALMERQLEHMVRLVDDLLDVSRINRGTLELRKEPTTIQNVVQHALDVCRPIVQEHGHELSVVLPHEPVPVVVDKTRLAQALCNLLSNAAKYSDRGGRIQLSAEQQEKKLVIRVRDTGIGIPPAMLPRVFEMFMQVDRSLEKSQGGLGVGLTIVKRLIELHHGRVEAHSEGAGKGSEFTVYLPVAESAVDESPRRDGAMRTPEALGHRILVVDDNVDSARTLAKILTLMGNEVHTAHDGKAAFEAAAQCRPALILLDIGLPQLNGYDVARRIRAETWGQSVTLVALTGWGQEDDRRRSRDAGFDLHLVKPVEPETLERVLAGLSAGAR